AGSPSAGLGCIAGVSKESTAVQSCWTWVKRAFILPIRKERDLQRHPSGRSNALLLVWFSVFSVALT
ncbi:hypothetical protein O4N73_25175, partial [Vibrio parahaemolyticus]|nr:hypothetical protein [Vibrio parahaemolyticus]